MWLPANCNEGNGLAGRMVLVVDTPHMMADLIDGKLFDILNAGSQRESLAYIVRDDESPSGFRTIFEPHEHVHGDPVDHQVTPKDAIRGGRIDASKLDLVVTYLETSFGLTGRQAVRVAGEAHETVRLPEFKKYTRKD